MGPVRWVAKNATIIIQAQSRSESIEFFGILQDFFTIRTVYLWT